MAEPFNYLTATEAEIRAEEDATRISLLRKALAAAYRTMPEVRRNRAVKGQWRCPHCGGVGVTREDVHHRDPCPLALAEYALLFT
jgi:rubrerythrin